ncbi:MAG: DUF2855 family protein [Myxococcota bacterium]
MTEAPRERVDLCVRRDDWSRCRFETSTLPSLDSGQVLLGVERFALTSNNISYAAAGDLLDYWGFFPAEGGWGRIPAMGFGRVLASSHPEVAEGERVFGFFPMATHLVIRAKDVTPTHFVDGSAHRQKHAQAYRQYSTVKADPLYDAPYEDQILLLRGLFMTSFLVDHFLADHEGFGAETYAIGSASSKTAIALAALLARRGRGRVLGFTSPRNLAFVRGLGFYDDVLPYAQVESLPSSGTVTLIDHSGEGPFVDALHRHLEDRLAYSCIVGGTHWQGRPRSADLPGPEPSFFFAPAEIQNRVQAWGASGFQDRLGTAWREFCEGSGDWLRVVRHRGRLAVEQVYREVLEGRAKPDEGHVLSLEDGGGAEPR